MQTMTEAWFTALNRAIKGHHYAAIRDAGVTLADTILDLADSQVDEGNAKTRVARARVLLHEWIGKGDAKAMPPSDLLFAIAVVLDTVELPGSKSGLGTEVFAQACELGLTEPVYAAGTDACSCCPR